MASFCARNFKEESGLTTGNQVCVRVHNH
jgi:hypothetical protein